ncbi:MAG TPA: helix-turn-helix domain-containing protein [Streptosporangiaceae bacterium]|jgi:hypothetical protein|nr:helix-turn-helix domain-containing protein [Streptosporangiaceae bacterium]
MEVTRSASAQVSAGEPASNELLVIAAAARKDDGFRSPAETARAVSARIALMTGCDQVVIRLVGVGPAAGSDRLGLSDAAWSQIIETGECGLPVTIDDVSDRPELWDPRVGPGVSQGERAWRSGIFVPAIAGGRLVGIVCALRNERGQLGARVLDTLLAAARLAGIALDISMAAARMSDLVDGLMTCAVSSQELTLLNDTTSTMTELALQSAGDPVLAICETLAQGLHTSVLVWDLIGGKTRAFSGRAEFRSQITELLVSRDQAHLKRLAPDTAFGNATAHPIGRDRALGLLLVETPQIEPTFVSAGLVKHSVALLAFDLESDSSDRTARNVSRPSMLHALVSGRLSDRQAHDVGAYVDAVGQRLRIGFLSVCDDATATATSHRLNFSARRRGCLAAAAERDGVILLVEDAETAKLRATVLGLVSSVSAASAWSLGISEPFVDFSSAPAALAQAHIALASAAKYQIVFHDEIGPTAALLKYLPPGAVPRFVDEILKPLTDYDREHNGSLVKTLRAYLQHRGSLRKAAEELFVHANTVQLRLGRVGQLTGIDLHDPRQIGILSLAFAWRGQLADGH